MICWHVARRRWVDTSSVASTAAMNASPTTPAATATVPSARPWPARWLAREAEWLLPVDYYHVVFTLPAELSDLALANPRMLYNHLFQAASATLRDVPANPKRLGAQMGVLAVRTLGGRICAIIRTCTVW